MNVQKPGRSAGDTFLTCISRVKNHELKCRLQSVLSLIENASNEYEWAAERGSLHEIAASEHVGGVVSANEMEKVYTNRMAKIGSPGRPIYEGMILSARNGICPLCGHAEVRTLDHHLPKFSYPSLAVTPINLVPSCTDCNQAKRATCPDAAEEVAINPYFDNIVDRRWLKARIEETSPPTVSFFVDVSTGWEGVLAMRIQSHFSLLNLPRKYSIQAANEWASIRHELDSIFQSSGEGGVRLALLRRSYSAAQVLLNGWRNSTFEAMAESKWFCRGGFRANGQP